MDLLLLIILATIGSILALISVIDTTTALFQFITNITFYLVWSQWLIYYSRVLVFYMPHMYQCTSRIQHVDQKKKNLTIICVALVKSQTWIDNLPSNVLHHSEGPRLHHQPSTRHGFHHNRGRMAP